MRYFFFYIIISLSSLLLSSQILAEEKKYLLSEGTWKKLNEVNKLIESGDAGNAIIKLKNLLPETQGKDYDRAVVQQTLGYAYNANNNYPDAIQAFRRALNSKALPDNVSHELEYNLAQLLIFTKNYKEGLAYFNRWIRTEPNPSLDAYLLAGTAYYESEQYKNAIPYVKNVINLKSNYDETWHQILLSCYLKTKQYENAARLLEKMLKTSPDNKTYWQQLLATWQHTNNDKKVLATMELMYTKGLFNGDEIKQLINMYLYLDMPYKAAKLLNDQMDMSKIAKDTSNWELLGNCWLQAHERDKSALALIKAASLSGDGKLYDRVGQIYFDLEDYPKAVTYLQKAVSAGKLKQFSYTKLLLGIALFHQNKFKQSLTALEFALRDNTTKDQAEWWIQRIHDLEQERNQYIIHK